MRIEPASLVGGAGAVGTVTLTTTAPAGGTVVTLTSSDRDVEVPATVTVLAGQTTITFGISTHPPHSDQTVRITATASGVSQTGELRLLLQSPGARSDEYTTAQGAPLVVAAPGILDNDTRRSGHDLTAELVMGPMSGTLTLLATGGFTYRPNLGFHGRDRFIYRPLDGATYGNQQHVWITVTAAAPAPPPPTGSQTFNFTGGAQTFTVPAGVALIVVEAYGAAGAASVVGNPAAGGQGGSVTATLAVTPGELLQIFVGGSGASGGFNGGAAAGDANSGRGGGSSDVRMGGSALANRVVAAGGGGGAGWNQLIVGDGVGGAGGGLSGGDARDGSFSAGTGGRGGSQVAGGAGGTNALGVAWSGAGGALGNGGVGGAPCGAGGGGGGGGYFGGGGGGGNGCTNGSGGGGGGSSFATATATSVIHQQGVRSGNGIVIIRW